jgi:hypothetical protein
MQRTVKLRCKLTQRLKIEAAVLVTTKARLSCDPALNDMDSDPVKQSSMWSWHAPRMRAARSQRIDASDLHLAVDSAMIVVHRGQTPG